MAALDNPKHERFAQELFKGATADQAYQEAGYKANRHNAAALARQQHISTRVAELQEKAALRAEITAADVTKELHRYANALANFGIVNEEGAVSYQHLNAARQCLMDLSKLNGWIVDHSKVESQNVNYVIGSEPADTPDEWLNKHKPE